MTKIPKYRKKPVIIEAVQWDCTEEALEKIQDMQSMPNQGLVWKTDYTELYIHTLEGDMKADKGDYIIKGVNGELYPCKPDIFFKTYEPVTEEKGGKEASN